MNELNRENSVTERTPKHNKVENNKEAGKVVKNKYHLQGQNSIREVDCTNPFKGKPTNNKTIKKTFREI